MILGFRSNTTLDSYGHQLSNSPRGGLFEPPVRGLKRQSTLTHQTNENLTEHPIKSRRDFVEAVESVFEKDLARKSLDRKNRVNPDILLDNHAFKNQDTSYGQKVPTTNMDRYASEDFIPSFARSSSLHDFSTKTVCMATIGKHKKKKLVIQFEKDGKKNIKI